MGLSEHNDPATSADLQLRCKRCRLFYLASEMQPCRYHPGRFQQCSRSTPASASLYTDRGKFSWTCCTKDRSASSTLEHSEQIPGCQIEPEHEEDLDFTRAAALVPISEGKPALVLSASVESSRQGSAEAKPSKGSENKQEDAEKKPGMNDSSFHVYSPIVTDTLSGLAIRFGVSEREIQAANHTTSREVFQFKQLLIPRHTTAPAILSEQTTGGRETLRRHLINQLIRAGCEDIFEAAYYLDEADGNFEKAKAALATDLSSIPPPRNTQSVQLA